VCLRIQRRRATVKALHRRRQHADPRAAGRLVRRMTVVIDLLGHHVLMAILRARWGLRLSGIHR